MCLASVVCLLSFVKVKYVGHVSLFTFNKNSSDSVECQNKMRNSGIYLFFCLLWVAEILRIHPFQIWPFINVWFLSTNKVLLILLKCSALGMLDNRDLLFLKVMTFTYCSSVLGSFLGLPSLLLSFAPPLSLDYLNTLYTRQVLQS